MTRLSCCCDWGFDFFGRAEPVPDIFCFGGYPGSFPLTAENRGYFVSGDSWDARDSLGLTMYQGASGSINGKGYMWGGTTATTPQTLNQEYDPSSDNWTTQTSLPSPARYVCAGTNLGSYGLVSGGQSGGMGSPGVDEYDQSGDSWSAKTGLPSPTQRSQHDMQSTDSTTCYAIGGQASSADIADNDEYDRTGDSWTSKTDITSPARIEPRAIQIGSYLYVAGGRNRSGGGETYTGDLDNNDRYDPSGDSWSAMTTMSYYNFAGNYNASGGDGYYHHGLRASGFPIGDAVTGGIEKYDVSGDSWSSLTSDSQAKSGAGDAAP